MALEHQLTGMTGVYLAAAELSNRGFIVSPTSRSARGADLLVTDQGCQKAWSVQVKTNAKKRWSWSLGSHDGGFRSDSHIFVFVNLKGDERPEYLVVPSGVVADNKKHGPNTTRCYFNKGDGPSDGEGWGLFGNPRPFRRRRLPQAA
jgi:hypothetical protein